MKSREEHMQWCKDRALKELDSGNIMGAIGSMVSDLKKHKDTENHIGQELAAILMLQEKLSSKEEVKEFIEGFH